MAKILIVDNEQFTLKIAKKILEGGGHEVLTAESGQACLDILAREPLDLVLMDIMMPEMSGWDVVKKIREDEQLKDLNVVMLSAKQKEADKELLDLANGYIPKPFDRAKLLSQVDSALIK